MPRWACRPRRRKTVGIPPGDPGGTRTRAAAGHAQNIRLGTSPEGPARSAPLRSGQAGRSAAMSAHSHAIQSLIGQYRMRIVAICQVKNQPATTRLSDQLA
jgi:hypothetical protein